MFVQAGGSDLMEECNVNDIANSVARAIVAAFDCNSGADTRNAAVCFLDSFKTGDVRVLASTSFFLARKDWSSEIRLHAFKMLQHLVRSRWMELTPAERLNFANVALDLMSDFANHFEEWALKSQMSALVAEILRREGLELWQTLLPSLISLSSQGPIQAELISMMLRWLPEDITVYNEDLEGDRLRLLLQGLTQSLPDILPLLYTLLERHFGAALSEVGKLQHDVAKQHAATVVAALNAINAYAEWAPLPELAKHGIIHGCRIMLSTPDFRIQAHEFFKLLSSRKRPTDASAAGFDSAMSNVFQILMNVSGEILCKSGSSACSVHESELKFMEYTCESMACLGSSNLQCIIGNSSLIFLYLQQMLGFFQHFKFSLHYEALLFWMVFMKDATLKGGGTANSAVKNGNSLSAQASNEKAKILSLLCNGQDTCSAILDVCFQHMLRREKVFLGASMSIGQLELWNEDFGSKCDFCQYRSKLSELLKLVASLKPQLAGARISEKIFLIIESLMVSPSPIQELGEMECMQVALENVVSAVFDESNMAATSASVHGDLCKIFEGLLQKLLCLKWEEPALIKVLSHYLEAMGPFLKYCPDAAGSVISKLFQLLSSLPVRGKASSVGDERHTRLLICTSFVRIAKASNKSILPHMKCIGDTMTFMQREGHLLRGEHNILGEAFLIMASNAGLEQQQEVLAWLLEPFSKEWMQAEWQDKYLSEPMGLVKLFSDTQVMWSVFHTVTFFEKALRRSGFKNNSSTLNPPMASHLSWMLPPLLKLIRAIHSLWSPPVFQALPAAMKATMTMNNFELRNCLGDANFKADMNKEWYSETSESSWKNWIKGIRDSGYSVLGLSTTIGDHFFTCLDIQSVGPSLLENIQSMEFRHMKQLVQLFLIPLVKVCPKQLWDNWLAKLLCPLFLHLQRVLSFSWDSLVSEGKAKVPDVHDVQVDSDLKVEVIEEKLLRDLTREASLLLATVGSPKLNSGLPRLEQSGHTNRVDASSLKSLESFTSSSLVGCLLTDNGFAVPALQFCLRVFTWTDSDSVIKVSVFCSVVIVLAVSTNCVELREFVSRDLFSAIIKSLQLESNSLIHPDLVALCRLIFTYLHERDPGPRQVLLSLPCASQQDLTAFEEAIEKTTSPKEQKQLMRSFLLGTTGDHLKALAKQRSVNVITNVTVKRPSVNRLPENRIDEGQSVGLAAIS